MTNQVAIVDTRRHQRVYCTEYFSLFLLEIENLLGNTHDAEGLFHHGKRDWMTPPIPFCVFCFVV